MNVFFGMDVPGSNPNDPSFFLRLPHLWPMFVIPIACFYAFLSVWVVRKIREATAAESHGSGAGPSGGPPNFTSSSVIGPDDKPPEAGTDPPHFDLQYIGATG
jgi:hypothetical protein